MFKKDAVLPGFILGVITPILTFWIYCLFKYLKINQFAVAYSLYLNGFSSAALSLSLLGNLGLFYFYIWKNKNYSARGVLMATVMYAIIGFLLKFFA
jgi:hypothetical protein